MTFGKYKLGCGTYAQSGLLAAAVPLAKRFIRPCRSEQFN